MAADGVTPVSVPLPIAALSDKLVPATAEYSQLGTSQQRKKENLQLLGSWQEPLNSALEAQARQMLDNTNNQPPMVHPSAPSRTSAQPLAGSVVPGLSAPGQPLAGTIPLPSVLQRPTQPNTASAAAAATNSSSIPHLQLPLPRLQLPTNLNSSSHIQPPQQQPQPQLQQQRTAAAPTSGSGLPQLRSLPGLSLPRLTGAGSAATANTHNPSNLPTLSSLPHSSNIQLPARTTALSNSLSRTTANNSGGVRIFMDPDGS